MKFAMYWHVEEKLSFVSWLMPGHAYKQGFVEAIALAQARFIEPEPIGERASPITWRPAVERLGQFRTSLNPNSEHYSVHHA